MGGLTKQCAIAVEYAVIRSAATIGLQRWSLPVENVFSRAEISNVTLKIDETGTSYSYALPNYLESGTPIELSGRTITAHASCDQMEVVNLYNGNSNKRELPVGGFVTCKFPEDKQD